MFEQDFPPRKDHLVTAKMLEIYQASAETQLEALRALGNSAISSKEPDKALEVKIMINMQNAWLSNIKRIKANYFEKLHAIAMMYMDLELQIFSLAFLKGASDQYIAEITGKTKDMVKLMRERMRKDIDDIRLYNDISGV